MDWEELIEEDWPKIVISENKILLNARRVWTEEEWEKYRRQVLDTPLP